MSKFTVLLLIAVLCLVTLASAKTVCEDVKTKSCKKVRREPFTKLETYKKPVSKEVKVIKVKQIRYKQPICATKTIKQAYEVPYKTQEKVSYKVSVPYTVKESYKEYYNLPIQKTKIVTKKVPYTVTEKKKFSIPYYTTKIENYTEKVKSTCTRKKLEYYYKQEKVPYTTTCEKKVQVAKWVNKKVFVQKPYKYKYWTKKYVKEAEDCWKKVYAYTTKYKKVEETQRVKELVWKTTSVSCVKYKYEKKKLSKYVDETYVCYKNEPRVRKIKVKKYKTEYKDVKVIKYKDVPTTVTYTENIKKYRIKYRDIKKTRTETKFKYVTVYKTKTAYRTITKSYTSYKWATRDESYVTMETQTKFITHSRSVPAFFYKDECSESVKRVCKQV